ncbi:ABC transporter substrate-binding protein [Kordiimonas laminariae]|uniref:ABC transporter substrate-binding protein n=1 Tax=Kordiimonas laminariae TaxID=2917717 RepID=UPI001FF49311|nr:ABC transporter substrate-binding protein [Kordiimonas laminariae]MCK0071076.1 ABC transporter substrate-binding protein [Kordiimonas laminariae]
MALGKLLSGLLLATLFEMVAAPSQAAGDAETQPLPSVVSLDYCADQYILALADRSQIKAVSKGAREKYSFYRARAAGVPYTESSIAEVIALQPEIAIQSYTVAARMPEMAERTGFELVKTRFGSAPEIVLQNVRTIGKAIGREAQSEAMAKTFEARLQALKLEAKSSLQIAYVTPSGFTSGVGTFVDGIIELAGFRSYAASKGYQGWLLLPLEDLIMDPPDMFVTSFFDTNMENQSNWSLSRHDRLLEMMDQTPTVHLPGSYLACNGLFLADAAEAIRAKASEFGILKKKDTADE